MRDKFDKEENCYIGVGIAPTRGRCRRQESVGVRGWLEACSSVVGDDVCDAITDARTRWAFTVDKLDFARCREIYEFVSTDRRKLSGPEKEREREREGERERKREREKERERA